MGDHDICIISYLHRTSLAPRSQRLHLSHRSPRSVKGHSTEVSCTSSHPGGTTSFSLALNAAETTSTTARLAFRPYTIVAA